MKVGMVLIYTQMINSLHRLKHKSKQWKRMDGSIWQSHEIWGILSMLVHRGYKMEHTALNQMQNYPKYDQMIQVVCSMMNVQEKQYHEKKQMHFMVLSLLMIK